MRKHMDIASIFILLSTLLILQFIIENHSWVYHSTNWGCISVVYGFS